jgi:hypothetical protein
VPLPEDLLIHHWYKWLFFVFNSVPANGMTEYRAFSQFKDFNTHPQRLNPE